MFVATHSGYFLRGALDSVPFVFVAGPFGLLFGVLATDSGLRPVETLLFSLTVFAGASQFSALQLMQEQTPTVIVLVSALAVNLRVAMYSASLTPFLGGAPLWQRAFAAYLIVDQSYALSVWKFESNPGLAGSDRMAYFVGTCALIAPLWMLATLAGAVLGEWIPKSISLDFAFPIVFAAIVGPMLRTPAHLVAALTACATAIPAAALPFNLGLITAGLAGMFAGARVELWIERRQATPG